MKIRSIPLILALIAGAVIGPGLLPAAAPDSFPDPSRLGPVPDTAAAISMFQARVETSPNPIDLTVLAQLEARRSRETGDLGELTRAEAALDEALLMEPEYGPAVSTLAAVYSAMHRFDEALAAARRAQDLDPRLGALALIGDVLVATGDYEGAAAAYSQMAATSPSPGLAARLAYLDELWGDLESAIGTMELAAAAILESGGVGEEAAWFQVRLGDLNFSIGNLTEADRRYAAALTLFPGYWSGLAGLAKVSGARGDLDRAIDLYESAAAVVPRPELMLALGDLNTIKGELQVAADRYATVGAIAELAGGAYDRTLALYLAEHGQASEALELATEGLEVRRDIYGYDSLAWALHHLGRTREARAAMDRALELGTRDAHLLYHSGAISLALGDSARAAADLSAALELNPAFHPLYSTLAVESLEEARR